MPLTARPRSLASLFNDLARKRLGCDAELIVDEFGEKILEELDYTQEARNIQVRGAAWAGFALWRSKMQRTVRVR